MQILCLEMFEFVLYSFYIYIRFHWYYSGEKSIFCLAFVSSHCQRYWQLALWKKKMSAFKGFLWWVISLYKVQCSKGNYRYLEDKFCIPWTFNTLTFFGVEFPKSCLQEPSFFKKQRIHVAFCWGLEWEEGKISSISFQKEEYCFILNYLRFPFVQEQLYHFQINVVFHLTSYW